MIARPTSRVRSHGSRVARLATALAVLAAFAGCASPGVNHAYVAPAEDRTVIVDLLPGSSDVVKNPTFLSTTTRLLGLAYEPFTDHFFLRVPPGNRVRVVDRPGRVVKREFNVGGINSGGGDLAVRSSDRHLFLIHPTEPAIVETDGNGNFQRTIWLESIGGPPAGVAYDQKEDRLLILTGGNPARVTSHDLKGKRIAGVALDQPVELTALAFDSDARELYAALLDQEALGVFASDGALRRVVPLPPDTTPTHFDVGPRSFVRVF